ncbi:MAG TPA: hypothetical protein VGP61_06060 [Gemmatimonadales bacterium]|jgi:hypothetical protein|nr:hypothetical protein [Gemmatimonadales bacterium]
MSWSSLLVFLAFLVGLPSQQVQGQNQQLGPKDGAGLPRTDTSRVAVGTVAPDFTLAALVGPPVTLSQFRGKQKVILVFYRGHW